MCPQPRERSLDSLELLLRPAKVSRFNSSFDGELDERSAGGDCSFTDISSVECISEPAPGAPVLEFLSAHGLQCCTPVRLLGTGATCRVDLVLVSLPAGWPALPAARKTMPRSKDPHMRAKEDALFAQELEGLRAGLGCPFVVRLLGTATHPDRQELLMELAEGNTLEHELSAALGAVRGELTQPLLHPGRIGQIAVSVLTALAALHSQGLAHLDIKPANLLLTTAGRLMVGDVGCTQRVAPDGLLHAPASGTPLYAAPEAKRKGAFSVKADLYSVGVMLAVCAAWHRQTGRVLAFLRGAAPLPDHVPAALQDLVARLVAVDPEQRPSAAEALRHPFLANVDLSWLAPQRYDGAVPQ